MTDAELLRLIVTALSEGRAEIAFSGGLESHMDFPSVVLVVAGYFGFWRGMVRARMRRRFIAKAMADMKTWRKSWSFAGITLKRPGEECRSPQGDWRAFAQGLKESQLKELP